MIKLNVGCGANILDGWINLDKTFLPGVTATFDLESIKNGGQISLMDNSVDEFLLSHLIEHISDPLSVMQEMYRLAAPNALMTIKVPYGSSDDAWEDPTHVKPYFLGSFGYFGQPYYWRADYGYRADWQVTEINLMLPRTKYEHISLNNILDSITHSRNIVSEMSATLMAIKPSRQPLQELQIAPKVQIVLI